MKTEINNKKLDSSRVCYDVILRLSFVVVGLFLGAGCKEPPKPAPVATVRDQAQDEPKDVIHQINYSGEGLALISTWYTGKATNWKLIRDANPGVRPESLRIGQRIVIPASLVIRRDPFTKTYVSKNSVKATRSKASDGSSDKQEQLSISEPAPEAKPTESENTYSAGDNADSLNRGSLDSSNMNKETINNHVSGTGDHVSGTSVDTKGNDNLGINSEPTDLVGKEPGLLEPPAIAPEVEQQEIPRSEPEELPKSDGTDVDKQQRDRLLDELLAQ